MEKSPSGSRERHSPCWCPHHQLPRPKHCPGAAMGGFLLPVARLARRARALVLDGGAGGLLVSKTQVGNIRRQEGSIRIKVKVPPGLDLPPMRLRIYEQLVLWPQQGGSSRLGEAYPRVMPALVGSDLRADRGLGNRTSPTGSPSEVPPSQEGNRHKRTQSSPRADACRGEASIWAE